MFVATTTTVFCCDKNNFVATEDGVCCDKHVIVATKMILVAVIGDNLQVLVCMDRAETI